MLKLNNKVYKYKKYINITSNYKIKMVTKLKAGQRVVVVESMHDNDNEQYNIGDIGVVMDRSLESGELYARIDFGNCQKLVYDHEVEVIEEPSIQNLKKEIAEKQRELSKMLRKEEDKSEIIKWNCNDDRVSGKFTLEAYYKNMSPYEILKELLEEIDR